MIAWRTRLTLVAFVAPALLLYLAFQLYPYADGFHKALTDWDGLSGRSSFTGLDNFRGLAQDEVFLASVRHTILLTLYSIVPTLGIAMFLAIRLNRPGWWAGMLRAFAIAPTLLSPAAAAVLGAQIYQPQWGVLNTMLRGVGLEGLTRPWLGDPTFALPSIAVVWVWYAVGFYLLIFHAALQTIPPELVEAAKVDGASPWHVFRHITLPTIWGVVQVAIVFFIIGSFVYSFTLVSIMTRGGPSHATELMPTWLVFQAFSATDFGYASAIGVAIFGLTLVVAIGALRMTRREAAA